MNVPKKEIIQFQKKILSWYEKNKRDLPWRDIPVMTSYSGISFRDPYAILVSEVMSHQTQIARVVPKFEAWMERFPTLESLAVASTRDVLQYWSGLGYNRRALYLKKCAETLVGRPSTFYWPQTEKELRALPGIGEYTARALLCFAFEKQIAVVDTNVKKIIAVHFFKGSIPGKEVIEGFAAKLLPKGKAYDWNQALMDYAAAELKKEKIILPKQSKFHDSDRYYRGQILKHLLEQQTSSVTQLFDLFKAIPTMNEARLQRIIKSLVKDKLVLEDSKKMVLSLEE